MSNYNFLSNLLVLSLRILISALLYKLLGVLHTDIVAAAGHIVEGFFASQNEVLYVLLTV